jgi:hypothetical protein
VISDNYFPKQRSRTRRRTLGMFCSSTLHFPSFASIPIRDGCSRGGYYILHLPRQAIAWSPLGRAPDFTLHTTPHLCWCLTVCFHTPLWGLREVSLQRTFPCGSLWFFCGTPPNFPMWFSVVATPARAPQLPNPRDKHLSPESPLPRLCYYLNFSNLPARRSIEGS